MCPTAFSAKRQTSQKFTSTVLLTHQEKKGQGSSQEIKFQGPEEAKRRVKKKFMQVDKVKKIVKDVNSKSR